MRFAELRRELMSGEGPALVSRPFSTVRDEIDATPAFQLIRQMPKGGLLHVHSSVCGDARWMAEHCERYQHCQVGWKGDESSLDAGHGKLFFSPEQGPDALLATEFCVGEVGRRRKKRLVEILTFGKRECAQDFRPWQKFDEVFGRIGCFTVELAVFRDYFEHVFRSYLEDGIWYVELRCPILQLTDFGKVGKSENDNLEVPDQFVREFIALSKRIQQASCPAFKLKLILTTGRVDSTNPATGEEARKFLRDARQLLERYPGFVIGVDFVGQETENSSFANSETSYQEFVRELGLGGPSLPLFAHAGETADLANENVVDAHTLGAKRIAHAINLFAYPKLEQTLRAQGTALEICPVSNQMLGYVRDLRLHPAAGYIRRGIPCVLGSDDPLLFGNHGLTYDFWIAWAAWNLSLTQLKELAVHSIVHSGMESSEKAVSMDYFERQWRDYLNAIT